MKRTALVLTVGLLVLIGWASLATTQTRELVVAAWGDPYEAGWRKALVPAFEKQHNAKIVWVQGFSLADAVKLRAQKDSPQVDVAMMDDGPHRPGGRARTRREARPRGKARERQGPVRGVVRAR